MSETSTSNQTTDHETIRRWAEERGGRPATVKATESGGEPGVLRFDFGDQDEGLEPISWEEFFQKFDEQGLAMVYQDETKDGQKSRFYKFVKRDD
jgi:hypothetical protein